jgi:hypothetical protein
MKGYLQRIAAGVVGPRSGVYPFVGSIFPGTSRGVAPDPLPLADGFVFAEEGERVSTREKVSEPPAPLVRRRESAAAERVEERPVDTRRAEHEPFQPLLPRREAGAEGPLKLLETGVVEAASDQAPVIKSHRPSIGESFADAARVEPLVVEDLLASGWRETTVKPPTRWLRESSGTVAGDAGKSARAALPPIPRSSDQRTDDIQIHIGRVEVIAVPPAAPRSAAVPPRKAMSLDEYLKRRDRRAG